MAFRTLKPYHSIQKIETRSFKVKEYDTKNWREYSLNLRIMNPVCAVLKSEFLPNMLIVDHIIPVNEGGSFWDERNHQVLSKSAHSVKSMKEKRGSKTPFEFNQDGEKIPKQII